MREFLGKLYIDFEADIYNVLFACNNATIVYISLDLLHMRRTVASSFLTTGSSNITKLTSHNYVILNLHSVFTI